MSEHHKILVLLPFDEAHRKQLENTVPTAEFIFSDSEHSLSSETKEQIHVIIGNPRPALLPLYKNLQWIQLGSAGADVYMASGVLPEHVALTNTTGAFGLAIAEYMIGMVLHLFLKLPQYRSNQEIGLWHNEGTVKTIYGSTALAIGLGDIGGEFAKRFQSLGGHVIGVRRRNADKPDYVDELYLMDQLDALLPRADVVALSLPETPETHKLFNTERLARMKPGAILLNVGRGTAIDTDALCDALNSGHLSGAALDVTDPEPLAPEHPLWHAKNVVITPHVSGLFINSPETCERVFKVCTDNLSRYFKGEPLKNIVDMMTGYKKHE